MEATDKSAYRGKGSPFPMTILNLAFELIGPSHMWPRAIQKAFFQTRNPTNSDRFKLICFFVVNGLHPTQIRNLFMMRPFTLDKSAWRQIEWVLKEAPHKDWTAYNVAIGKSTTTRILKPSLLRAYNRYL